LPSDRRDPPADFTQRWLKSASRGAPGRLDTTRPFLRQCG